MTKKIYLFLFFCVLFANQAWAQSGTYTANGVTWKYEINGTEATITGETVGRDNFTGALNIPDEVIVGSTHYPVTGIGMSAFGGYLKATSVQIPESITGIGAFAFQNVNINGPLSLPHVIRIGTYAFYEAKGITGPLSLPELIEIGQDAFYHTGITSLSLPKVINVGAGAFSNCHDLSGSVSLPEAKIIGSAALAGTPKLTGTLSLPKVEKIESYALNGAGFTGDFIFPASLKEVGDYALVAPFRSITFEPGTALTSLGSGVFAYNRNLNYLDLTNVVLPA